MRCGSIAAVYANCPCHLMIRDLVLCRCLAVRALQVAERDLAVRLQDQRESIVCSLRAKLKQRDDEIKTLKRLHAEEVADREKECERVRRRLQGEKDMEKDRHRHREAELERLRDRANEEIARLDKESRGLVDDMQAVATERNALQAQTLSLRDDVAKIQSDFEHAMRELAGAREEGRRVGQDLRRVQSACAGVGLKQLMLQREVQAGLAQSQQELAQLQESHVQAFFAHTQLCEAARGLEGRCRELQRCLDESDREAEHMRAKFAEEKAVAAAEREMGMAERMEAERVQAQGAAQAVLLAKERDQLQLQLQKQQEVRACVPAC